MFFIPHVLTVVVSFFSLFWLFVYSYQESSIWWLLSSYAYYKIVIGTFGNQISQHRYFSHNSFKTSKAKEAFLYCVALTTGINPIFYAMTHRHHHLHSDTKRDRHSPHNRLLDAFSPIFTKTTGDSTETTMSHDQNSAKLLVQRLYYIYKWHNHILLSYYIIALLISRKVLVFIVWAGIAWNLMHMVLFRTWLVHTKLPGSYTNFETGDKSWNNKFIQLFDWGEGLHNNHHRYPNKYDQALKPGEFDPVGWLVGKLFVK